MGLVFYLKKSEKRFIMQSTHAKELFVASAFVHIILIKKQMITESFICNLLASFVVSTFMSGAGAHV